MSAAPPVLPDQALRRVLAIARADGWSVVLIAALGGLVTVVQGAWIETAAAGLVVLAGLGELHGHRRLLRRDAQGLGWMIAAQLFLLAVIWAYAWWRWRYFDPAGLWAELPGLVRTELDRQLLIAGLDPELDRPFLLQLVNRLTCFVLAVVSAVYQGGLAAYYALQGNRVRQALAAPPPPSPPL
ncbi:hypothetical protein Verru16b_00755 [Lacunisphaera limnophila]|uniref:DUF4199 domain-containing protein n=1 Tax=Lacunisphaera limnophila TaxID=1838286 RepID=A0A1D8AS57_9BACT|nr:hypothetical protein [Lacunisphaera limnophila]AOS43702.1 hypothetical protein Verru16b_00755 [Lacunisphaera limnophila]